MYYLITYNYNGEMKELSTICADYESLVEKIIKGANFFFPCFLAYSLCMQDFIMKGEGGEIYFSYRKIDAII